MDDRTVRSYKAGARLTRDRINKEAPLDAAALEAVSRSDVVVVKGHFDRVERVLVALELPFTEVQPGHLTDIDLRPEQLLIVNCPGDVPRAAVTKIRDFVAAGGSLFTTDWALRNVIEPAFPNTISYNERPTGDEVVGIEVRSHDNPFLTGVMDDNDNPQWWLESVSYPIHIHEGAQVEVLLESPELERRYGAGAVAVLFPYGNGEVFHMISHYFLQRTELRTDRHRMTSAAYVAEKGMQLDPATQAMADDLTLGEIEAAHSSSRVIANIIASKKRKTERKENNDG